MGLLGMFVRDLGTDTVFERARKIISPAARIQHLDRSKDESSYGTMGFKLCESRIVSPRNPGFQSVSEVLKPCAHCPCTNG